MSASILILATALTGDGAVKGMISLHEEFLKRECNSSFVGICKTQDDFEIGSNAVYCLERLPGGGITGHIKAVLKLHLLVRKIKPDFFIINTLLPEIYACFSWSRRSKFIVVEHSNPSWPKHRLLGRFVRTILVLKKARFVSVSEHIRSPFLGRRSNTVIPNPVSKSFFTQPNFSTNVRRLVYIGRLSDTFKNPSWVIQIAKRTKLPVNVFGSGPELVNLKLLSSHLEVDASFSGWEANPWNKVEPGDLMIVPSTSEGDGLVVIEAISLRVPILLNDVPDLRRFRFPSQNYCKSPDDFAERIEINRFSLEKLRPSTELQIWIQNSRNASKIAQDWINFLMNL